MEENIELCYFRLEKDKYINVHDAKEKIQRQPADHIGGSAVCFLRDLFSGRCIPSSGMYVHGNHLY